MLRRERHLKDESKNIVCGDMDTQVITVSDTESTSPDICATVTWARKMRDGGLHHVREL